MELIVLKNSVFGQLGASWQNTVPLRSHSANIVYQTRIQGTVVLRYGIVFLAREFFNRTGPILPLLHGA
jgi:hypothetical protein